MSAEKRWVLKPQGDAAKVAALAAALDIPPVLANLLVQRGIETEEEAWQFFNPKLENLHDPFLMKDMDRAVERIDEAVKRNEPIMVYGDYDVDGTTAVALVYSFLRRLGLSSLLFYIPDRYTEGYGISVKAIDYAQRKGVGLIIALDCGIKATEKVAYAKTKGIDFIICDHHLPGDTIPEAVAVLDSKRPDCNYPFKELSGCGVGFKMLQGYCQFKGLPFSEVECLLDLVVVSIASDIVPLVGENRILAYYGLKRLNEKPGKGLSSIIKICGLDKHVITIDDIVFKIGPRINAAGRMEVDSDDENAAPSGGHSAVYLMVARDEEVASEYGAFIDTCNQDRKNIDRSITQEAHEIIESRPELKNRKSTEIDSELLFSDITHKFRTTLNRFQPFGPENNAPVFVTRGVSNRGDARLVGAEQEHLKMDLIQGQKPNTSIPAIAFQQPTHYEHVRSGKCIDVCYSVVENHYRGTVSAQLRIKDIKKTPVK